METIDFTINNDEIEKISKRIHELQTLIEKDIPLSDEQMDEYKSLFRLKDLLYRANQIDNQDNFIVIDGMRIERSKVSDFKELLKIVNVPGLVTMPNYLGDILPGTKYKMPRAKTKKETFEEYEEYLKNYYKKLGYKFENITYHPGTTVPILRKPYPHEMYYPSENGFIYDERFLGTHNVYYQEYRRYLEEQLALEYQEVIEYAIENFEALPPIGHDIAKRHKVTHIEPFVLFIDFKKEKRTQKKNSTITENISLTEMEDTPLIKALKEKAKALIEENRAQFENKPLETLTPDLKVDSNIPENLKNALIYNSSNEKERVVDVEIAPSKLIARAEGILSGKPMATNEESLNVEKTQNGSYLYNMVPKDILIGNALSKRTVGEKRIAYEIASKFRHLMNSDSTLSHYYDMVLKNFLAANKELTTNDEIDEIKEETVITENNMRVV